MSAVRSPDLHAHHCRTQTAVIHDDRQTEMQWSVYSQSRLRSLEYCRASVLQRQKVQIIVSVVASCSALDHDYEIRSLSERSSSSLSLHEDVGEMDMVM